MFELAEGATWSNQELAWYWVDILDCKVFRLDNGIKTVALELTSSISNVIGTPFGFIVSLEDRIVKYSNDFVRSAVLCKIKHGSQYRCNDGSVCHNGNYYFGTMEKSPRGLNGKLFCLDKKGNISEQGDGIGIPNSFIWLDEQIVLISDSFLQKTFKVPLLSGGKLDWTNREVWLDLSGTVGTPDGGAIDEDGNIWLAVWGDASIHKYSQCGHLLDKIILNALQPTSCTFGGENMDELLITTATEGMSDEQLQMYPDSGKVMLKKMDVKGKVLPVFNLEV